MTVHDGIVKDASSFKMFYNNFLFTRFGATPKVLIASVVGYFLGKVSYMDTCREKFLTQVPNSNISIAIRKARGEEVFFEVNSFLDSQSWAIHC
jgi:hypothetical protein